MLLKYFGIDLELLCAILVQEKEVFMNTEELKLYVPERLKNRIVMMANERKLSINKMSNYILEVGIYKIFEEESEYGKLIIRKSKKESDKDGESSYNDKR